MEKQKSLKWYDWLTVMAIVLIFLLLFGWTWIEVNMDQRIEVGQFTSNQSFGWVVIVNEGDTPVILEAGSTVPSFSAKLNGEEVTIHQEKRLGGEFRFYFDPTTLQKGDELEINPGVLENFEAAYKSSVPTSILVTKKVTAIIWNTIGTILLFLICVSILLLLYLKQRGFITIEGEIDWGEYARAVDN